ALNFRRPIVWVNSGHSLSNFCTEWKPKVVAYFKCLTNSKNVPILRNHSHFRLFISNGNTIHGYIRQILWTYLSNSTHTVHSSPMAFKWAATLSLNASTDRVMAGSGSA